MLVDFDVRGQQEMDFFTGVIMNYELVFWAQSGGLKFMLDLFLKNTKLFTLQDMQVKMPKA